LHPINNLGRTHAPEDGGHVRDGYTMDTYRAVLTRAGFEIKLSEGLGSPLLLALDRPIRWVRNHLGDAAALPLFLLLLPLSWLDWRDPGVPVSLYVRAVKREE
jgi:hypothetical protein